MAQAVDVRFGDRTVRVDVATDGTPTIDGAAIAVTEVTPGEWHVVVEGRAHRVLAAGPPESPWLWLDGVAYRPEVIDARQAGRERRREAAGDLAAPMPATVRAIHVQAGDAVSRGQTLVVLEAMKMELPLKAPADGVVASVACRVGELVQPGVPLVVLA